jgi:hypothetical protein
MYSETFEHVHNMDDNPSPQIRITKEEHWGEKDQHGENIPWLTSGFFLLIFLFLISFLQPLHEINGGEGTVFVSLLSPTMRAIKEDAHVFIPSLHPVSKGKNSSLLSEQ